MKVTKAWVTGKPNGQGYLASVAMDVEFQGGFIIQIRGMRLIETKDRKVVLAMPNIKDSKGNWQNIFSPLNPATRAGLEEAAIEEWKKLWPNPELREMFDPL